MAHGLCVYDSGMRLVVCNRRYLEIYGLAPHEAKPGMHLADLVRFVMRNGAYPRIASSRMLPEN
jgi:PAS domain-containing protein